MKRVPFAARVVIGAVAALVGINVALGVLDSSTRGADETAPRSSSFSTGATGVGAWAELLRRDGRSTGAVRGDVTRADLDPAATTLVVIDPDTLSRREARRIARFVAAGGRLVAGGESSAPLLELVLGDAPVWASGGSPTGRVTGSSPETVAIARLRSAGGGTWRDTGTSRAVVTNGASALVTVADVGLGRVVAIADPSLLQNQLLDRADNAAFSLTVAGDGRAVRFAEGAHGYGRESGLGAIPDRWKVALALLAAAAVLGAVAAGRRLGPPEETRRALPPPRRAYVDALATTLSRTGRPDVALAGLQADARDRLARRVGLAPEAGPDELRAAGTRLAVPPDEVEALLTPVADDAQALAAGRALARLGR